MNSSNGKYLLDIEYGGFVVGKVAAVVVDGVHSQDVEGFSLHDHDDCVHQVDLDVGFEVVTVVVLSDQGVSDHVHQGDFVVVVVDGVDDGSCVDEN